MKKASILITLIYLCGFVNAQQTASHEQQTREGDFKLRFPDTTNTESLHVKCVYDDNKTDDIYSVYLGSGKSTDPDFTLNRQLNFDVFADKFTAKCKSLLSTKKAPDIRSIYEVYAMIWYIKNAAGDAPEAGTLQFSRGVLIFDKNAKTDVDDFFVRRNRIDSIDNRLIEAESAAANSRDDLEETLEADTLYINSMITRFETTMKQREWLDKEELYPCIVTLDSFCKKFSVDNSFKNSVTQFKNAADTITTTLSTTANKEFRHLQNGVLLEAIRLLKGYSESISQSLEKQDYTGIPGLYAENSCLKIETLVKKQKAADSSLTALLNTLKARFSNRNAQNGTGPVFQYAKINKVEMQFERGFIETMKVWVTINSSEFIFENIYAMGFSSRKNYKTLAETRLFMRNGNTNKYDFYIYVSDVFRNYDNRLNNFTRDYSPADTAFLINPAEHYELVLRKEKFINILDAKIYGDLTGIDKTKPNGLVQIEISKRFNINTTRVQSGNTRSDFGYLNYVEIFGSVSKIEQHNKQLVLHNAGIVNNGNIVSPNYATNLDFLRYENYTAGLNIGLMLFDVPDFKFTAYLDLGVKYGHCQVADSVFLPSSNTFFRKFENTLDAHTLTFQFPKISLELFPESRITPKISWQLNSTRLFSNNQFKQVVSYEKSDNKDFILEKKARLSNQYEIFVKIAPNKERASHVFLRWRFFTQFSDANTSFSQFQVGYAYNWTLSK